MGEQFNSNLNAFFGCEDGAYSVVTPTEADDSQVTTTGYESEIFRREIEVIPRGSVKKLISQGVDPLHKFRIYPSGEFGSLNTVLPKKSGNEVRIYLKAEVFKPAHGMIWCVFLKDGQLWLGALDAKAFLRVERGLANEEMASMLPDVDDSSYQEALYAKDPAASYEALTKRFKRDPRVARDALEERGYICELRPDLETFPSRVSGKPYLEVHHVIPVSLQSEFECSLDVLDNVAVLNPWSHRLLHHAPPEVLKPYLGTLCESRGSLLQALNLKADDVLNFYSQV